MKKKFKNVVTSIYEAVTVYYSDLMAIASREYNKVHGYKDEDLYRDIAHDTLLRICDIFADINVTEILVKNYYCKAVRMNYLRELVTADSKNKERMIDDGISLVSYEKDEKIDFGVIIGEITKEFGERDTDIFIKFYSGYTQKELNEMYNINNSDYIIRKIKKYIQKHYDGYDLKKKRKKS